MKNWSAIMIFYSIIESSLQEVAQPETYIKYVYNCAPGGSWLLLLIGVMTVLLFYTSHTKKDDYYRNQIHKLKLENELLLLRTEYETHKVLHEKTIAELRQMNANFISELTPLKNNVNLRNDGNYTEKEYCECRSKGSWGEHCDGKDKTWNDDYEGFITCDIKRRRFGQLRRSVSTSSLPSEHDETPTSSPPPENYDITDDSAGLELCINNNPPPPKEKLKITSRNIGYLTVPDITITDTVNLRYFDNFPQSIKN